jgi:hypothetical protein
MVTFSDVGALSISLSAAEPTATKDFLYQSVSVYPVKTLALRKYVSVQAVTSSDFS